LICWQRLIKMSDIIHHVKKFSIIREGTVTLIIMYADIVTDILVNIKFHEDGHEAWFTIGMICLGFSYVSQLGMAYMAFREEGNPIVLLFGLVWLYPALPLYDIVGILFGWPMIHSEAENWKSALSEENITEKDFSQIGPIMTKTVVKGAEMVFETIPQTMLQTYIIFNSESYSYLQAASIFLSFMSIGMTTYTSFFIGIFDTSVSRFAAAMLESVYTAWGVLTWAIFAWAFRQWFMIAILGVFAVQIYTWLFFATWQTEDTRVITTFLLDQSITEEEFEQYHSVYLRAMADEAFHFDPYDSDRIKVSLHDGSSESGYRELRFEHNPRPGHFQNDIAYVWNQFHTGSLSIASTPGIPSIRSFETISVEPKPSGINPVLLIIGFPFIIPILMVMIVIPLFTPSAKLLTQLNQDNTHNAVYKCCIAVYKCCAWLFSVITNGAFLFSILFFNILPLDPESSIFDRVLQPMVTKLGLAFNYVYDNPKSKAKSFRCTIMIVDIVMRLLLTVISLEFYDQYDSSIRLPDGHDRTRCLIYIWSGIFSFLELTFGYMIICHIAKDFEPKQIIKILYE